MLDVNKIRNDFPMFKNNPGMVYLDNGATTFKSQSVIDTITSFYTHNTCNVHAEDYTLTYNMSKEIDKARETVKDFLNAKDAKEIVFTKSATESLNTVAFGYGLKNLNEGDVILSSFEEHASSVLPWFIVAKEKKCSVKYVPIDNEGRVDLNKLEELLKVGNVKIIDVTYVSNVLGYINPVKEICALAHQYGAIVNVDGTQAVPHIKVDVQNLDVDFISFSAHKMTGPDGVGVLYGKFDLLNNMNPFLYGGGANARFDKECNIILKDVPERFEAGSPNTEAILGLKAAVDYLSNIGMKNIEEYEREMKKYLVSKIKDLDNLEIYNLNSELGLLSFNVKGIFAQDVTTYLNTKNICVRSGNHCAKILHNLIGTDTTIRASIYFYNTKEEIDLLVDALKNCTLENCIGVIV